MKKNKGILILEKSMNEKYVKIAKLHGWSFIESDYINHRGNSFFEDLMIKFRYQKKLKKDFKKISENIIENELDIVYISNPEGYYSYNIISKLQKKFPKLFFVGLQHGIFDLSYSKNKEVLRSVFNNIFKSFTGFYFYGAGFGGIYLDKYIVFSKKEEVFLANNKKWQKDKIEIDFDLLKGYLIYDTKEKKIDLTKQDSNKALFLLQGLTIANQCSELDEKYLIMQTVKYLSQRYEVVLLKDHPACQNRLEQWSFPANVIIVDNILEGVRQCKVAYSFFSTSLLDVSVFKLDTYAIYSTKFKLDKEFFKYFANVLHFEKDIDNKS